MGEKYFNYLLANCRKIVYIQVIGYEIKNEVMKMLISETVKNGTKIELRSGINGSGKRMYSVQTERIGTEGQVIKHCESFSCILEAKNWIKWII